MSPPGKSIVSSMKIAVWLRDFLKLPLITGRDKELLAEPTDILFIVNSSTTFTTQEFRDYIPSQILKSKIVVYIQNDYLLIPRKFWKEYAAHVKAPFIWWTGDKRRVQTNLDKYMDFNVITYNPISDIQHYDNKLFYFGSYRAGRENDMKEFLNNKNVVISASSSVQLKKFTANIPKAEVYCDKSESIERQIQHHAASLILVDKSTVRHMMLPPNRFYECLAAGRAMLFHENTIPMFEAAGYYSVRDFVVRDWKKIKWCLDHAREIAQAQRKWRRDYQGELKSQIISAMKKLRRML